MEGKARLLSVAPTLSLTAYADGDQIGSAMELVNALDNNGDTGAVLSVTIIDKIQQNAAIDIHLFNAQPVIASSDNSPLNISDAEMTAKYLCRISMPSNQYSNLSANSVATLAGIGAFVQGAGGSKSLWAVLQSRGTPTYTSSSDLTVKIGMVQD